MRSKIAPLVGRLGGDEAREALGEAEQFAALGECFVYLHWVSQATGSPSATFHSYADHYLTSAISLIEDRTGAGSRDAAKKRAQARRQVDTETLHSLLNTYLNMPIHLITETKYPDPSSVCAPAGTAVADATSRTASGRAVGASGGKGPCRTAPGR